MLEKKEIGLYTRANKFERPLTQHGGTPVFDLAAYEDKEGTSRLCGTGYTSNFFEMVKARPGQDKGVGLLFKIPPKGQSYAHHVNRVVEARVLSVLSHDNIANLVAYNPPMRALVFQKYELGSVADSLYRRKRGDVGYGLFKQWENQELVFKAVVEGSTTSMAWASFTAPCPVTTSCSTSPMVSSCTSSPDSARL